MAYTEETLNPNRIANYLEKPSEETLNPNRIANYLGKPSAEFTRKDLIKYITDNKIEMINFRYTGGDGRLKTLNFVISSIKQLNNLLSGGERVDGSSLFPFIDAASSDLYVVPRFKTAYVNPFTSIPTIDILCSYFTSKGTPLPSAPENVLKKAHDTLKEKTGYDFQALGEVEYYIMFDEQRLYPMPTQRGYHGSSPFSKWEKVRAETMVAIAQAGGQIKYGHSEVGHIHGADFEMEQHEIEFLPEPVEDAADHITIAKWMLRMIGHKYGVAISFAPKIMIGHAGSGLHIHTRLMKNGENMMTAEGALSDAAKRVIAGYLRMASSITAFGNTIPVSYLRLVPHQEAPTNICWGDRNRSVLVRVPLGWLGVDNMIKDANPRDQEEFETLKSNQTVEFRCPDGSADVYFLLAALTVAARHGLEMKDAMELTNKLYVDVNIFSSEHKSIQKKLPQLPSSCWASAENLSKDRELYEKDGVFSHQLIDATIKRLKSYDDKDLSERFYGKGDEIKRLIETYINYA